MQYPQYAEELKQLLDEDQSETKALGRKYWQKKSGSSVATYKTRVRQRTIRMLQILEDIGTPSISNIGTDGALAISVLATHDAPYALKIVLKKFEQLYAENRKDCRYQSIPAMTDWLLILQRKPQQFGTQWLFDHNHWPYLPTVVDFAHLDERRAAYGLGPLCWPKSLAIPESEQPWLKRPLSELTMRDLTQEEFEKLGS